MSYATDGLCHNAEPGTYGHECCKPAEWIGQKESGFRSGFCDDCKRNGYEAKTYIRWDVVEIDKPNPDLKLYGFVSHAKWEADKLIAGNEDPWVTWVVDVVAGGWQVVRVQGP